MRSLRLPDSLLRRSPLWAALTIKGEKMYIKAVFFIVITLVSSGAIADKTNFAKIRQVNYNASADFLFFLAEGGWQVTNGNGEVTCTPVYVQITSSVPGRDKILSIGLAANFAKAEVQFHGNCATDPNYFNANYIITK